MDHRRALRILPPAFGLLLGALSVTAAPAPKRRPAAPLLEPVPVAGTFEGVSSRGSIQEALDDALSRASRAMPKGEGVLRYRVSEIGGEREHSSDTGTVRLTIQTGITGMPRVSRR